ncbi:hypothetical protein GCM10010381_46540 [Streptomyces xantholiticus]|nr:hypothetical protein GCM10010381_46540 [Streptomyces xantholiticus]
MTVEQSTPSGTASAEFGTRRGLNGDARNEGASVRMPDRALTETAPGSCPVVAHHPSLRERAGPLHMPATGGPLNDPGPGCVLHSTAQ